MLFRSFAISVPPENNVQDDEDIVGVGKHLHVILDGDESDEHMDYNARDIYDDEQEDPTTPGQWARDYEVLPVNDYIYDYI